MTRAVTLLLSLLVISSSAYAGRTMVPYDRPRAAPQFDLPGISGDRHQLADFKGRYLLVNFWAVWCSPCRKEMPSMQRAYDQLKGRDFEMVAIHVGPSLGNAKEYAEKLGLSFTILVDEEMQLGRWQVQGLPTTFLIDRDGQIIAEAVGERAWDSPELLSQIRAHLPSR